LNGLSGYRKTSVSLALLLIWAATGVYAGSAQNSRMPRRPDPKVQLLNNYRRYPDRYIRIPEESWKFDQMAGIASHSFTLKNSAAAVYSEIEIRFTYLNSEGKILHSRLVKMPGSLAPYEVRKIKNFKVKNVPAASDQVLLAVAKALIPS
jgi:hypothetical protein